MKDKQFKGYQVLRDELRKIITCYQWNKEDLTDALSWFKADGIEILEALEE
ncbi:MAG: hypothetical protein KAW92_10580 [Candidatus Cloacimonetes bacterium]|nr:hypothetical protein [Candidatus Cloacimonadota bacterium]